MDIRVLKYFVVTVQSKSINAASRELFITQPTLTRQFHELEDELGHRLFERSTHGIKLTEKGQLFYQRALEVLELVERMKGEIKSEEELQGVINIGAAETSAMRDIAKIMSSFVVKHPFVTFNLTTSTRQKAFESLDSGVNELGLIISAPDPSYNYILLKNQCRWGLITLKQGPFADKEFIRPIDLRGMPLIASPNLLRNFAFEGWLGYSPDKLRVVATYNLLNNTIFMVEEGVGHTIAFEGITNSLPESLMFLPFAPEFYAEAYLIWKSGRQLSKPAQALLEEIREKLSSNN